MTHVAASRRAARRSLAVAVTLGLALAPVVMAWPQPGGQPAARDAEPAAPVSASALVASEPQDGTPPASAVSGEEAADRLGELPTRFEPNQGQADPRVAFTAQAQGTTLFVTHEGEAVLVPAEGGQAVRLQPVAPADAPTVSGVDELDGVTNYARGDDPEQWATGVPGYAGVRLEGLWPGLDVVWRTNDDGAFEYDVVAAPGADPERAVFAVAGADDVAVADSGALRLDTADGQVRLDAPVAFQTRDGQREPVESRFAVDGHRVGFAVGDYDASRELVVDPSLEYATYLGSGADPPDLADDPDRVVNGEAVAVDAAGVAYVVVNQARTAGFPTSDGAAQPERASEVDAYVAALAPDGSLEYGTYLGGGQVDVAQGVAVDAFCEADCRAVVTGFTHPPPASDDASARAAEGFPTTDGAAQEEPDESDTHGFVAALTPQGRLAYSTYLDHNHDPTTSGADTAERLRGVAVDGDGQAAVAGAVCEDPDGHESDGSFLQGPGSCDAWVVGLAADGSAVTFDRMLAGEAGDAAQGVARDAAGRVYVAGVTDSGDFPTTAGVVQPDHAGGRDAFVAMLTPAAGGVQLSWATYLGGSGEEPPAAVFGSGRHAAPGRVGVAVDAGCDSPGGCRSWVATGTESSDMPTTEGVLAPHDPDEDGCENSQGEDWICPDGYVASLSGDATGFGYATYLGAGQETCGGPRLCRPDFVHAVAVRPGCGAGCVATVAGETDSDDFPWARPAAPPTQERFRGEDSLAGREAFVARLDADGGGLAYSTPLGGTRDDFAVAVAVDPDGGAVLTGGSLSEDLPAFRALQPHRQGLRTYNAFVAALGPLEAPGVPRVEAVTPAGGPSAGGTEVRLTGEGLAGARQVAFDGVAADDFDVDAGDPDDPGDDALVAIAPPHEPGTVAITVTTEAGTSPATAFAHYTYAAGLWQQVGSLSTTRQEHTTTLLADGRVLVAGGLRKDEDGDGNPEPLKSAELYDPTTRRWTPTDEPMTAQRRRHVAALLSPPGCEPRCGQVLLAGPGASAELYDPQAGTFTAVDEDPKPHKDGTLTVLDTPACEQDDAPGWCGDVLAVGGIGAGSGGKRGRIGDRIPAERFDPASGSWTDTGEMTSATKNHTATLLDKGGKVLRAAGHCDGGSVVDGCAVGDTWHGAEVYDPETNEWTKVADLGQQRASHSATRLGDGRVLVVGGYRSDSPFVATDTTEVYDPESKTWSDAAPLPQQSYGHAMAALPDGGLLIAGRSNEKSAFRDAALYDPDSGQWGAAPPMAVRRGAGKGAPVDAVVLSADPTGFAADPGVCGFDCGKVLVVGSFSRSFDLDPHDVVELYTPPPRVTGVAAAGGGPLAGPVEGGTTLTLEGFGFTHQMREVRVGDASVACDPPEDPGDVPQTEGACRVVDYSTLEVDVPALPDGGAVEAEVVVVNEGGAASAPEVFTYTGPPGPVEELTATLAGDGQVELSWTAVGATGSGPPPATTYVIEQATGSGFDDPQRLCGGVCRFPDAEVGGQVTFTVSELAAGETYSWRVHAVDQADGQHGGVSPVASVTLPVADPGGVDDLAARAASASAIDLSWSAPASGAGGPPAGYVVKQAEAPIDDADDFAAAEALCGGVCDLAADAVGDAVSLTVGDLDAETTYHYALRARRGDGALGPVSNPAGATTLAAGAPAGVDDLSATAVSASAVELAWSAVGADAGQGTAVGEYVVKQADAPIDSAGDFDAAATLCECRLGPDAVGEALSLEVTDLAADTTYHYAVRPRDPEGRLGPLSNPASATTLSGAGPGAGGTSPAGDDLAAACPGGPADPAELADRDAIPAAHQASVDCAFAHGIVAGFADATYRPRLGVRRDQMASFVARTLAAAGVDLPAASSQRFSDVPADSPHAEAIQRLAAAGVVAGGPGELSADAYGPARLMRRDQMASFLLRAAALAADRDLASDEQTFADVPAGNAHFAAVNGAAELGLARGFDADTFGPALSVRRDQMATFAVRLLAWTTTNVPAGGGS